MLAVAEEKEKLTTHGWVETEDVARIRFDS